MRYLSVCSGIEAASVAWHPLGWTPVAFSEIDKFPSQVLAARYGSNMPGKPLSVNGVPNLGDMTKFKEWPDYAIDLLVGGTPCQSFSVAGLRKGLDDPRGNLMLTYLAIARRYCPRVVVWENVPGVLSSGGGRDFGTLLRGLDELGYHAAWRVLDAQYVRVDGFQRAVPQRRRRVFVVGYLGDWRRAAAVLLESEGMRGNPPPRRQARQVVAPTISACPTGGGGLGTDFDCDGGLIADEVSHCVTAGYSQRFDGGTENFVAHSLGAQAQSAHDHTLETYVAHSLRAGGFDASEDGTGRGTPLVPLAFMSNASGAMSVGENISPTLRIGGDGGKAMAVAHGWAVRRLTPTECERLQGFPNGWTDIGDGRGGETPDGPRYKALGNSMAVNVMRWIGARIDMVERLTGDEKIPTNRERQAA